MPRRARPWYRRARKMWYAYVGGKQTPLGVTDPKDEAGANDALQRLTEQLANGIAAKLLPPPATPPSPPVSEVVSGYLAACRRKVAAGKLKEKTVYDYGLALAPFVTAFGPRPVGSLTAEEIEEWAAVQDWTPSTQNTYLGTIQSLLKWAGRPLPIKRPPKESRGAETILTDEQFKAVLCEARKYAKARGDLCELLMVLRETGARPQEIAQLHVDGIDWPNACTRLRDHKTRRHTGTDRIIHFNSAAMEVLKRQREKYQDAGLLFRTRSGNAYRPSVIVRRLGEISDRLGYRVIAYGLGRHSFATKALAAGVPDALVAELLGQKGTGMLAKHYAHLGQRAAELKAAAELASRAG